MVGISGMNFRNGFAPTQEVALFRRLDLILLSKLSVVSNAFLQLADLKVTTF